MTVFNRATATEAAPLKAQITHLEKRILDRRQLIRLHATSYGHAAWNGLTSPVMLLSACGLGFLVGILTRHQPSAVHNGDGARPRARRPVDSILRLIGFMRTLLPTVRLAASWLFPPSDAKPRQG
jgi:hypothetical protein